MLNRYKGVCDKCGKKVPARTGLVENNSGKWTVTCMECSTDSNNNEDYQCSDMGYEDACSEMCGLNDPCNRD